MHNVCSLITRSPQTDNTPQKHCQTHLTVSHRMNWHTTDCVCVLSDINSPTRKYLTNIILCFMFFFLFFKCCVLTIENVCVRVNECVLNYTGAMNNVCVFFLVRTRLFSRTSVQQVFNRSFGFSFWFRWFTFCKNKNTSHTEIELWKFSNRSPTNRVLILHCS